MGRKSAAIVAVIIGLILPMAITAYAFPEVPANARTADLPRGYLVFRPALSRRLGVKMAVPRQKEIHVVEFGMPETTI